MSPFPAYAAALRNLRLPLAYVDLARFDQNADDLVRRVRAGEGPEVLLARDTDDLLD